MPGSFEETVDKNNALIDGSDTVAIAVNSGTTLIKTGPGRLVEVSITTAGTTGVLTFFDNIVASGKVLWVTPANQALGAPIPIHEPFAIGLTVTANAASPAATVTYS